MNDADVMHFACTNDTRDRFARKIGYKVISIYLQFLKEIPYFQYEVVIPYQPMI